MTTLETFIVSDGSSHADSAQTVRLILRTVKGSVDRYETDMPVASADWPSGVVSAAEVLRGVAARTGRVERGGYAQTGIVAYADDQVWSAFVEFAPWAYDATVWNSAGHDIVSLADEAQSIVVRINRRQYDAIAAALGDASLRSTRK
jgi:crotonobetainyl-CoA:carnitine CoA-transferase CaiB-like acyl-CoA transferase